MQITRHDGRWQFPDERLYHRHVLSWIVFQVVGVLNVYACTNYKFHHINSSKYLFQTFHTISPRLDLFEFCMQLHEGIWAGCLANGIVYPRVLCVIISLRIWIYIYIYIFIIYIYIYTYIHIYIYVWYRYPSPHEIWHITGKFGQYRTPSYQQLCQHRRVIYWLWNVLVHAQVYLYNSPLLDQGDDDPADEKCKTFSLHENIHIILSHQSSPFGQISVDHISWCRNRLSIFESSTWTNIEWS